MDSADGSFPPCLPWEAERLSDPKESLRLEQATDRDLLPVLGEAEAAKVREEGKEPEFARTARLQTQLWWRLSSSSSSSSQPPRCSIISVPSRS